MIDLSNLPIPMAVLYAGLAGTVLALIVATYQNNWSCRVFFLLALRLAIGWHFLFEGLYKVQSHYTGETETNKPFSSELYFSAADGPLGPMMRRQFGDIDAQLKSKTEPQNLPLTLKNRDPNTRLLWEGIATSTDKDFATYAPLGVEVEWKKFTSDFAEKYKLTDAEKRKIDGILDADEEKELAEVKVLEEELESLRLEAEGLRLKHVAGTATPTDTERREAIPKRAKEIDERLTTIGAPGDLTIQALASYGRWTAGTEGRPSKVKYIGGSHDPALTAPQRLAYIAARQKDLDELQHRIAADLGNGPNDRARLREIKALVSQAKSVLLADAEAFLLDLKKHVLTTMVQSRLSRQAPPPSVVVAADPQKFESFVGGEAESFDKLPNGVQELWVNYVKTVKSAYPDEAAEAIDLSFELSKVRLVNWYNGRDEFSGRNEKRDAIEKRIADATKQMQTATLDAERQQAKQALDKAQDDLKKLPVPAPLAAAAKYQKSRARAAELHVQAAAASEMERVRLFAQAGIEEQDAEATKQAILKDLDARYKALGDTIKVAIPAAVADWPVASKPAKSDGAMLDKLTMWTIVAVGAMLLGGFATRIACIVGAIFLVMTYLTHPPFPWLPLPPNTEGNPLFVNKNVIEMLALMVIASFPTGRWMGLDALIHKIAFWKAPEPT